MDSSRNAANKAILGVLQRAGTLGVHIDDIMTMLGFEEKKQILPRLYALQIDRLVERLNGQKWRILALPEMPPAQMSYQQPRQPEMQRINGPLFQGVPPAQIPNQRPRQRNMQNINGPSHTGINRLGQSPSTKMFISYKNLLQEYCQKQHLPVPKYSTERGPEYGFICSVMFDSTALKSSVPMPSPREAEQMAAFEAMKYVQLLPPNAQFNEASALNNPAKKQKLTNYSGVTGPHVSTTSNSNESKEPSYKSLLNEFAQRAKIPLGSYSVDLHHEGFVATLHFNDRKFNSIQPMKQKKLAEQSAAYAALLNYNQLPSVPEKINQNHSQIDGSFQKNAKARSQLSSPGMAACSANAFQQKPAAKGGPVGFTGYKNKLQEYLQQRKKDLPTYETTRQAISGFPGFQCTVTVEGSQYKSEPDQTKKGAEQNAARVALFKLGVLRG